MFSAVLRHGCSSRAPLLLRSYTALRKLPEPTVRVVQFNAPRRQIHPALAIVIKQLLKVAAVVTGRGFRKWWTSLPGEKRKYLAKQIVKNRKPILAGMFGVGTLTGLNYALHLQETPITGRKRYLVFKPEEIDEITTKLMEPHLAEMKSRLYPPGHPHVKSVQKIIEHILNANTDIKEVYSKQWKIFVEHNPKPDLYVVSDGSIFISDGMINICRSVDQLACLLSHEIAHAILNHPAETFSHNSFVDNFVIVALAVIWAVIPSQAFAAFSQFIFHQLTKLTFSLPYSRELETEADYVGLELAAKSCFDIREFPLFWEFFQDIYGAQELPEYLSTHPAHGSRMRALEVLVPGAIKKRIDSGCEPLLQRIPRRPVAVPGNVIRIANRG